MTTQRVNSQEFHLPCEVRVQNEAQSLPLQFSWTVEEDGITKELPLYNDRKSVPHGVTKYALRVAQTKSELVIKHVTERDLKLYSCRVSLGGTIKATRNVTLMKTSGENKVHSSEVPADSANPS